jgi:Short C-terminal domain
MNVTGRMVAALAFDWADSNLTSGLGLCAVLLVGAAAIALVKRWRQRDVSESLSPSDQLAEYRSLYEQGVMSKEEFDRLRALLGGQLREMTTTATPARDPQTGAVQAQPPGVRPLPPRPDGIVETPPAPEAGNGRP